MNKIALISISLILALVVGLAGCGTKTVTPGYIQYDHELGYGFEYPEDWESQLVEGEDVKSVIMFTEPGTTTTLVVAFKLSNLSLEEVSGEFREELGGLGGVILEEREIVVNDREGYEVIYKPFPGVKIRQVMFIANGNFYMLVCSTEELLYGEYEETFDNVIYSFIVN